VWVESVGSGNADQLLADGQDTALIGVELVDAAGRRVPDSDVLVDFSIEQGTSGIVLATANGDPADHTANHSPQRRTFHGLARGFVSSAKVGVVGDFVLKVSAPTANGVQGATYPFTVVEHQ
jgi:beta-galactosidase